MWNIIFREYYTILFSQNFSKNIIFNLASETSWFLVENIFDKIWRHLRTFTRSCVKIFIKYEWTVHTILKYIKRIKRNKYYVDKFDFPFFWFEAPSKPAPTEYNEGHYISCSVLANKFMLKVKDGGIRKKVWNIFNANKKGTAITSLTSLNM